MLSTRQFSEGTGSSTPKDGRFGWNEGGPGVKASRTPVQGTSGGGALKRFSPETEPAYGTPLNVIRSPFRGPRSRPWAVVTSTASAVAGSAPAGRLALPNQLLATAA